MNVFEILKEISKKDGLSFLVIGGHAVNAYGYSRVTQDLDILVARENRDAWLTALEKHGFKSKYDGDVFVQTTQPAGCHWPVDLMLVRAETFSKFLADAREIEQAGDTFRVPSLDHLIALKLHALKYGPKQRGFKDLVGILSLAQANAMDVGSDSFRALCESMGTAKSMSESSPSNHELHEAAPAYHTDAVEHLEFPIAPDLESRHPQLNPTDCLSWCEEMLTMFPPRTDTAEWRAKSLCDVEFAL